MFRSWDRDQINKRSSTFYTGGQIFKLVQFQWKWAQIDWITKMIQKKYSFAYLGSQEVCESRGQRSMSIYGLWPLNSDPPLTKMGTFMVYETIHFLNLHGNLINLSPFSLKLDKLENLTPVQKVNDLLLFWPLSWEWNVLDLDYWLFLLLKTQGRIWHALQLDWIILTIPLT